MCLIVLRVFECGFVCLSWFYFCSLHFVSSVLHVLFRVAELLLRFNEFHWIPLDFHWIPVELHWISMELHWIPVELHSQVPLRFYWIPVEFHWDSTGFQWFKMAPLTTKLAELGSQHAANMANIIDSKIDQFCWCLLGSMIFEFVCIWCPKMQPSWHANRIRNEWQLSKAIFRKLSSRFRVQLFRMGKGRRRKALNKI